MDVLTFLTRDHFDLKASFDKLEAAHGQQASQLWQQLRDRLTLHETMEETFFYPRLKQDSRAEDLILESYQEHHVIDVLVGEISQLGPDDEQWQPKIKVLRENAEHHISEEQDELFPKVRKIWDTATRAEVGELMQQMKDGRTRGRRAA